MKKTIWLLVLNIVIGGICQAQLPERNAVNIENKGGKTKRVNMWSV